MPAETVIVAQHEPKKDRLLFFEILNFSAQYWAFTYYIDVLTNIMPGVQLETHTHQCALGINFIHFVPMYIQKKNLSL